MDKMNQAIEKMKMLVGMEVEDEQRAAEEERSLSFMEDLNQNCALSTKQVPNLPRFCLYFWFSSIKSSAFGCFLLISGLQQRLISYSYCIEFVQLRKLGS